MITCQHAKHLFDRYLDGELSPSLQAELHAHQLNCTDCQGELALLETCGDVITSDRREPELAASFTDRVLLAHRAQVRPEPRRWGRLVALVGTPMAAAASIAFALMLIVPNAKDAPVGKGKVLSGSAAVTPEVGELLMGGKPLPRDVAEQLQRTPQMQAGFVEAILGPFVEHTKATVDGTRQSIEQLDSLVRLGITGANQALAAGSKSDAESRKAAGVDDRSASEPSLLEPTFPSQLPLKPHGPADSATDDAVEAL